MCESGLSAICGECRLYEFAIEAAEEWQWGGVLTQAELGMQQATFSRLWALALVSWRRARGARIRGRCAKREWDQ